MPQEGRILYDNFYSAAVGLAFILGPVIGGSIKLVSTIEMVLLQLIFTIRHTKTRER